MFTVLLVVSLVVAVAIVTAMVVAGWRTHDQPRGDIDVTEVEPGAASPPGTARRGRR